jgi:hypothetical protein
MNSTTPHYSSGACCISLPTILTPPLPFMPKPPPRGHPPYRQCIPTCLQGCSLCIFVPPYPYQFDDETNSFFSYTGFDMHALIDTHLSNCHDAYHANSEELTPHSPRNIDILFNRTNTAYAECYDSDLLAYACPPPKHSPPKLEWTPSTHPSHASFPVGLQLQLLLDIDTTNTAPRTHPQQSRVAHTLKRPTTPQQDSKSNEQHELNLSSTHQFDNSISTQSKRRQILFVPSRAYNTDMHSSTDTTLPNS